MKQLSPYIVLFFVVVTAASCTKEHMGDCFKSTGDIVTEERSLATFDQLEINDHIFVFIEQGPQRIEVEAGENLQEFVTTDVTSDGTLVIENTNRCNWVRSYKKKVNVRIWVPNLSKITQNGTGDVLGTGTLNFPIFEYNTIGGPGDLEMTLNSDSASFFLETGPGDVHPSGMANYMYVYHSGNGFANCSNFLVDTVHVNNTSTGDFRVHSNKFLNVEIYNSGDVFYKGQNGDIRTNITGSGELIPQ
jgi:hypothetical protein